MATLRTRKALIITASLLSLLLHAGLIYFLLPQFSVSGSQANIAEQKTLSVKLSATAVSHSKPLVSEDIEIKQDQAEVTKPTKIIQQTKPQSETKNQKPVLSEVAKSKPAKPESETAATAVTAKQKTSPNQTQAAEQSHKAIQVRESNQGEKSKPLQMASQKQEPKQESQQETESKKVPEKPRYHLGSKANPNPDYPMLARKKGWQGDVVLGVHVAADGTIEHLTFVKSTDYGVLNYAAYETVRNHWRFDPLLNQGEELSAYIEVPISFRFN